MMVKMNLMVLSLPETTTEFFEAEERSNNSLLALIPMRQHSKVQEYVPGNFQTLTPEEREEWLAFQCELFEEEISSFSNETDNFVEELGKYLKKVTRRWASWNHRSYGPISSIEQVNELLEWEEQKFPSSYQSGHRETDSEDTSNNPLKRFGQYCEHSKNLLHIFRIDIYRPLCDHFCEDDTEVPKNLEKVVQKWEALLHFSPLNEKLFNSNSTVVASREKFISASFRSNRLNETDLVVRLIPDLCQKKLEVLRLATKWRVIAKAKIIQRRGTYTLSPDPLKKREEMPRKLRVNGTSEDVSKRTISKEKNSHNDLRDELKNTKRRYSETFQELRATQEKCEHYEGEMRLCKNECADLREQLRQTAEVRKAIEKKSFDSYSSSATYIQDDKSNPSHDALWEKELERIKAKYSRQKLKFMNSRKQVEALNQQLELSQQRCAQLQSQVQADSQTCTALERQLNATRKNIQTQGNMVDALQHQCYTLKQELDTSNIKKGELYSQLNNALEHCRSVEDNLEQAGRKYEALIGENCRRRSREEELERENTQLRRMLQRNGIRRKSDDTMSLPGKDHMVWKFSMVPNVKEISRPRSPIKSKECMFPDINAGRSF